MILLGSLYAWITVSPSYFYQDDFLDLALARQLGLGKSLFEQGTFGHFLPGFNLANYFFAGFVPYRWWIVELATVCLYALTLVLLYRLLTTLVGPTWLSVPLVALAGATFSLVPALDWWAQGLQQLVTIPALLFLIDCHVRYLMTGRVRLAMAGGASLVLALAFYDGALVGVLFVVLMTILIWPVGRGARGVVSTLLVHWPAWLCYGLPVAADLGWRLTHSSLYVLPPIPTGTQTVEFISLSWTQTFVPLLFGVDPWLLPTRLERVVVGGLGQLVIVLFVSWTIIRRRDAWRSWVLFAAVFLAMTALVGLTRVSTFGPGDASDVRYVTIDVFFFVIAAALAIRPVRHPASGPKLAPLHGSANSDPRTAPRHVRRLSRRPVALTLVVALLCGVGGLYAAGLHFDRQRYQLVVGSRSMRQFFRNFTMSWNRVESTASHPFLWDSEVNASVISASFYPFDTAALTVGKLHTAIPFDQWGGRGYLVQSNGAVAPAVAVTQASGVFPASGQACVTTGSRTGSIDIALDHPLQSGVRWFGLLSYTSRTAVTAAETSGSLVRFRPGSGTLITEFSPTPLSSVEWIFPAHSEVCITGFRIVVPMAEGSGGGGTVGG